MDDSFGSGRSWLTSSRLDRPRHSSTGPQAHWTEREKLKSTAMRWVVAWLGVLCALVTMAQASTLSRSCSFLLSARKDWLARGEGLTARKQHVDLR